jgi:regulation of enolase protein 1 (concanavalin A-like superfamily)
MRSSGMAGHEWVWTRITEADVDLDAGEVTLTAVHGSDYWRHTASGITVHNGHSLVTRAGGDVDLSARFDADLATQYDQVGLVVLSNELDWYKTSYELDGSLCVGGVRTRHDSDWSRSDVDGLGWLRVVRSGDVVESFVRHSADDGWRMIRQFRMPGVLDVGIYGAAPAGPGFTAGVTDIHIKLAN